MAETTLTELLDTSSITPIQEGARAMNADLLRVLFGYDGSGVEVGVISDSYAAKAGDTGDVEQGFLPGAGNPNGYTTPVEVLRDDPSENDEGRAMAQLVHAVAPGAAIDFHAAFNNLGHLDRTIAEAMRALADAGNDVIIDDVAMTNAPVFQPGHAAVEAERIYAEDGVMFFSAAGNSGDDSYQAAFSDSGEVFSDGEDSAALHDFGDGRTKVGVTVTPGETLVLRLNWVDPYGRLSENTEGAKSDTALLLFDETGETLVAAGDEEGVGEDAFEFLEFENTTDSSTFYLAIANSAGPDPELMRLSVETGDPASIDLDFDGPTIFGHPGAENVMGIGAAEADTTAAFTGQDTILESFSSRGPVTIYFDRFGNRLDEPVTISKPDFTAPDGIQTNVDGFQPFFGTSAAAPNAGAVAALLKQAFPAATAAEIYAALGETASPAIAPDGANAAGTGLIDAFAAFFAMTEEYHVLREAPAETLGEAEILYVGTEDLTLPEETGVAMWSGYHQVDVTGNETNNLFIGNFADSTLTGGGGRDLMMMWGTESEYVQTGDGAGQTAVIGPQGTYETTDISFLLTWQDGVLHPMQEVELVDDWLDETFYLAENPDVRAAGIDAAAHYDMFGRAEGRQANLFFDEEWYLDTYDDVAASGEDALGHYLAHGAAEGRDPSPWFDTEAYLAKNNDVRDSDINPLTHYLAHGLGEFRDAYFDQDIIF